mgnify:CR=1 FL=1
MPSHRPPVRAALAVSLQPCRCTQHTDTRLSSNLCRLSNFECSRVHVPHRQPANLRLSSDAASVSRHTPCACVCVHAALRPLSWPPAVPCRLRLSASSAHMPSALGTCSTQCTDMRELTQLPCRFYTMCATEKPNQLSSHDNIPTEIVMTKLFAGSGGGARWRAAQNCESCAIASRVRSRAACDRVPRAIASRVRSRAACDCELRAKQRSDARSMEHGPSIGLYARSCPTLVRTLLSASTLALVRGRSPSASLHARRS